MTTPPKRLSGDGKMQSGVSSQKWVLLLMVGLCLVAIVAGGLFLAAQGASTSETDTASAEVTAAELAEARPSPMPTPTPEIVTPPGTKAAPEFEGIVRWLNSQPLTLEGQQGKVVLVDFWTYS